MSVLNIFSSFTNLILNEIPVTKRLKIFWYLFTSLRNRTNSHFHYNIIKVCLFLTWSLTSKLMKVSATTRTLNVSWSCQKSDIFLLDFCSWQHQRLNTCFVVKDSKNISTLNLLRLKSRFESHTILVWHSDI